MADRLGDGKVNDKALGPKTNAVAALTVALHRHHDRPVYNVAG